MAALTTQNILLTGVTPAYTAASASDTMETGDRMFLHAKNTNAATRVITFTIPAAKSPYQNVLWTSVAYTIAATTGDAMIGPIHALFGDVTTGQCTITTSAQTNLSYGALKLGTA